MNKLCLNCGDKTNHSGSPLSPSIDIPREPGYCVKAGCQAVKRTIEAYAKAAADPSVENR